jgi:threonine aldolase
MSDLPTLPPPPERWFGSDNQSGAHAEIIAAIAEANTAHAAAYGDDRLTSEVKAAFRDLLGPEARTLLVWNGTGANVVALQTLLPKYGAVICTSLAHINIDETGAPEKILGAKLIDWPSDDAKLTPGHIEDCVYLIGDVHHVQPAVVSITQSTELGTLYSSDEIAAICDTAHRLGLTVHMDGARIANATVALGQSIRATTFDLGVDAISFGGTKNGMLYGEAVVFRTKELATGSHYLRKQTTQLPSKMRFVSAQFLALLHDDLWLRNAAHANARAAQLDAEVRSIPGVILDRPTVVNSLFPRLPADVIEPLQAWSPHYTWNAPINQLRWMTSFDTTAGDVSRFADGVRSLCAWSAGRSASRLATSG